MPKQIAGQNYYTTSEVAQQTGVHSETVRIWIRSGRLTAHKIGRAFLISEPDLESLLNSNVQSRDLSRQLRTIHKAMSQVEKTQRSKAFETFYQELEQELQTGAD